MSHNEEVSFKISVKKQEFSDNFRNLVHSRYVNRTAEALGKYYLHRNEADVYKRYQPIFNYFGVENLSYDDDSKLIGLGDNLVQLLKQIQNVARFHKGAFEEKQYMDHSFLAPFTVASVMENLVGEILRKNRTAYKLDEDDMPINGDYYNGFIIKAFTGNKYCIFVDCGYEGTIPTSMNEVKEWDNFSSEGKHVYVCSSKSKGDLWNQLQRRNIMIVV